jgi:flagellar biosynthetic protein FliR
MENILDIVIKKYEIFLLVFVRMTGIFVMTPIFSRNSIPNAFKIGFAFFISLIVMTTISPNQFSLNTDNTVILIVRELLVGLIVGFISYLFFTTLYIAGQIIDMQIGFGMVNVLDPQHRVQVPVVGNFFYIIAIFILLIINGHHTLIEAVIASYKILPIGQYVIVDGVYLNIIKIITEIFIIGFKISGPILATIFITNVMLGILARTVPQMNVFIVGMPLKIIVGFIIMIFTMPLYILALQHIFNNMFEEIFNFFKALQLRG